MYEQHQKYISTSGKCGDQQNLKDIIEAALLCTPERFTDNIPNVHMTSSPVKKPSARKTLCLFTKIFDVKPKTAKLRIVAENPNAKPPKWVIAFGPIKKTKRAFKNQ